MLRSLEIRNYALIESASIEFGPGLTIITGETGAGKSIMLGAMSMLLGTRVDSRVGAGKNAGVEAYFEDVDDTLRPILEERGIKWEADDEKGHNELIIRREVTASGKSKIYINDTSVTLATLREIGPRLIDIHSQHANAKLADASEQLHVIDVMSDSEPILYEYQEEFRHFALLKRRIDELETEISKNRENEQHLRFQYEQLDLLKPKVGELAEIERRYEILSDADEIKERFNRISQLLGNGESGVLSDVQEVRGLTERIDMRMFAHREDAEEPAILSRLDNVYAELYDIAGTIEDMGQSIDTDPSTLVQLSERMQTYYNAVKQYRVSDGDALAVLYHQLGKQLDELTGDSGELPAMKLEAKEKAKKLKEIAARLTEIRVKGCQKFSKEITELGGTLGLNNLRFEVRMESGKLTSSGGDRIEFMCAFNKRGELLPVGKTASGGEMSRLMLCIKSVMARKMNMPTVVFDEVDTGVSGEIADRMGRMMLEMGKHIQVITVTHLPQVASQGDIHYKVYKRDERDRTVTYIDKLDVEGRVREIAQMISGREITESARETAIGLLSRKDIMEGAEK